MVAHDRGLASAPMPANLRSHVESMMYDATY
jgi:hypothetical protein